ncbi:ester cyclase [Kribbella sp. NPDC058693]|uniref:ester cyclase n=1 Tax=Kribbella sp. NPDC058693 TaxID=3346602 RepID=UPI003649BB9D
MMPPPTAAYLRARYTRYLAALNERRFEHLVHFYPESLLVNGIHCDRHAHLLDIKRLLSAFPDWHWRLDDLLTDGTRIAARLTTTGTHEGPYDEFAPTHRTVTASEFAHYRITDGRFTEVWFLSDRESVRRQLSQESA